LGSVEVDSRIYRLDELYGAGEAGELVDFIGKAVEKLKLAQKLRWVYYGVPYERDGREEFFKMPPDVVDTLISMMDLVGPRDEVIPRARELFKDSESAMKALDAFEEVLDALSWYGVERYTADLSIARGLEYYTGTVFEIDCPFLGAQKQVCGGGRYDKLVEEFGGPSLPATGFALGLDRLILALERSGVELPSPSRADAYVIPLSPEVLPYAVGVARELRSKGLRIEMGLLRRRLGRELSNVDRLGIPFAIIIGPEEAKRGILTLRDMRAKEQYELSVGEAAEVIRGAIGR
ncbi:MAG TPA: histidine--tRNA ligase family protein, partial [Candidatus Bathyarchaeota archaeon]|nr:histidine--tRNA ligase family protein [Candidatus Bathyarchaeota archaeon]HEW89830.1 histidine--tRNA ligase family protein [Candidatus Bathyarchaeota archaeon]